MNALNSSTSAERAIESLMTSANDERITAMRILAVLIIPLIHDFMSGLRDQMFEHSYSLRIKIGDATIDFSKSGDAF